jgi:hypothetical protein
MAKNAKAPLMRKLRWPKEKPLPSFATLVEEAAFWERYEVETLEGEDGWEEVPRAETGGATARRVVGGSRLR